MLLNRIKVSKEKRIFIVHFGSPPIFEFGLRHHSQYNIRGFFIEILTVSTYTILPSIAGGLDFSFTIPIQLTIIKNVRLPAKARNYIHLHQGDMTEK